MRTELASLKRDLPPQYPFLHAIQDDAKPNQQRVWIRGNRDNLGDPTPPHFVSILSKGEPKRFTKGSGRLELAEAIVDPANPLTARVIVNRVWQHHFGQGIVRTPSNFGKLGERPDASRTARLPGRAIRARGMVDQKAASRDHAVRRLWLERGKFR